MNNNKSSIAFYALVVGWYGAPNVGDEVLLEVLKSQITRLGGTLVAASIDPMLTRNMHGIEAVDYNNLGEIARSLLWADVLIMGGGGIFQDHYPFRLQALYDPVLNDIAAYARPILMARQFDVPVVIWGHGIGPLRSRESRDIVREIFNNVATASVRDQESLRLLREIGVTRPVEVGPDPGWLYRRSCLGQEAGVAKIASIDGKRILAVVVREWMADAHGWKEKLVRAIEKVVVDGWYVHWVAFQANTTTSGATSDLPLLEELRERVPALARGRLLTPASPREAWNALAGADAVFSMRLHASILGLLAGKPVAGLEYDDKMAQAHAMVGMPDTLRVKLEDSQDRYTEALESLLGFGSGSWLPDPERIAQLEENARVHLRVLDLWRSGELKKKPWKSGQYDWLSTWLQQSLSDLRATKARSQLAHELLSYRDTLLSQKESELTEAKSHAEKLGQEMKILQTELSAIKAKSDQAHELLNYRDVVLTQKNAQLAAAEERINQLSHALAGMEELQARLLERENTLSFHEALYVKQNDQIAVLNERIHAMQLECQELVDELQHKSTYIEDKEIYIAQLLSRINHLEAELTQTQEELDRVRNKWARIVRFLSLVRRDIFRIAAAPLVLAMLWRRHGYRIAMQQFSRRVAAVGGGNALAKKEAGNAGGGGAAVVRPVRSERLLVITASMQEDGWLSRPAALAKAADRAGFFTRIWHVSAESEIQYVDSIITRLTTDSMGLLQEVRTSGTRILLADTSNAALEVAKAAKDRGAEVILDLSSIDIYELNDDQFVSLMEIASRAVSRDGNPVPRAESLVVERLSDAGDNEEFDSYKTYPYPKEFRKRRRNILLVADEGNVSTVVDELSKTLPHDQIHVVGAEVVTKDRVGNINWNPLHRASVLAASDVVLVVSNGKPLSWNQRALIYAALLLERRVISDVQAQDLNSKNFHVRGQMSWAAAIDTVGAHEDYQFISGNTWIGRVEQLMKAKFPNSVSVIVLIHNNRKIIERCISTMLDHCGDWLHEIIVVDNKSTDGGAELVEQLYGSHPKIKVVRNTENGCSSGRNLGVSASTGKYIAFFDSDQWLIAPSCFAEAIYLLEAEENVGAIGWNAGWFDATREDLGGAISDYVPMRGMNAVAQARGYRDDIGFLGTSGMFMKRELFDKIDGFDTFYDPTCFEDTDICFQIKKAGLAIGLRDLAGIRHQPHQTTGANESSERYRKLFLRNAEYFRKKWAGYPDFFVNYTD